MPIFPSKIVVLCPIHLNVQLFLPGAYFPIYPSSSKQLSPIPGAFLFPVLSLYLSCWAICVFFVASELTSH